MSVRPLWRHSVRSIAILAAATLAFTACSSGDPTPDPDGNTIEQTSGNDAVVAAPAALQNTVVLDGDSADALAEQAVQSFFDSASVVVIAADGEELRAASAAVVLGVPVLPDGPQTSSEIERLGAEVALAVGAITDPGIDVVVPEDDAALAELIGVVESADDSAVPTGENVAALVGLDADNPQLLTTEGSGPSSAAEPLKSDRDELPAMQRPEGQDGVVVMSTGDDRDTIAVATALASGARVMVVPSGDPRMTSETVQALGESKQVGS